MTDAQFDQLAGLISLPGVEDIHLYATPSVFEDITLAMARLQQPCRHDVHWHLLAIAGDQQVVAFEVPGHEGLEFTAFDAAPMLPGAAALADMRPTGERIAIGMRSKDSGRRALYVRGPGAPALLATGALEGVHCLLLDPGVCHGEEACQILAAWLAAVPIPRKFLLGPVHPSNTLGIGWPGVEVPPDGCSIEI